jgi:putative flippase GtrA
MSAYGLVSAAALGVDATILKLLVTLAGWHYLAASTASFVAGAAFAYLLSVRLVFRFRQVTNRTMEFAVFVALGGVGLLVNAATMSIVIGGLGLGVMTGKAFAAICTFSSNFLLRRRFLFSPARTSE